MRAKEAMEMFRFLAVRGQWDAAGCVSCKAPVGSHLRQCPLADALEATGGKDACPRCFADLAAPHAPMCPKAAKG